MLEEEQSLEIPEALAETPEAACVQQLRGRRWWLKRLGAWGALGSAVGAATWYYAPQPVMPLYFNGLYALPHVSHPRLVHHLVAYANQLVDKPYKWGGGHKTLFDNGFDCSGSISHVLYRSGLLPHASSSTDFARFGLPGAGRYVTVYVRPGHHVFMEVCGLRFDTTGTQEGEGPRWRVASRNRAGFQQRHPAWL